MVRMVLGKNDVVNRDTLSTFVYTTDNCYGFYCFIDNSEICYRANNSKQSGYLFKPEGHMSS